MERNTYQKNVIMDFIKNSKSHPTAEEIYNEVTKIIPNISKATVYRNLSLMADNGIIKRLEISGSRDRYDYYDKHYHGKCIVCGDIVDINMSYDESLDKKLESKYQVIDHEITFKIICDKCSKKKKE